MGDWWVTLLSAGAAIAVLTLLYHGVIRPWHLRWGTIGDETTRPLPGDDFAEESNTPATHAIIINASAEEVWPWLVQMGQGRGGFYSYTWLENLVGCQMKNANQIVRRWLVSCSLISVDQCGLVFPFTDARRCRNTHLR